MDNLLTDILVKLQLDKDSCEIKPLWDGETRFCSIEGEGQNGIEERYIIYDCSETHHTFDFERYQEMMKDEEGISQPIMVFSNWDKEWDIRQQTYNGLNKASDKKQLLNWFEKKISYYTESEDNIELEVEDRGENYLEYEARNGIKDEIKRLCGRAYNISFKELKKIYNVTGKELFRRNVRYGLKNDKTGELLQLKFKEYIKIGAYLNWIEMYPDDKKKGYIKKLFEIEEGYMSKIPQNFWFYHNGITIFSYGDDKIDFSGKRIKLSPKNISVINGAQTLTNFFEGVKALPEEFKSNCENLIEEEGKKKKFIEYLSKFIDQAMDMMKVKTVFIEGKEEYVQPITYGLNTQIPIMETDIIADSDTVEKINSHLRKKSMKIIKTGEVGSEEKVFSVLEFVKYFLIVSNQPGRSKNLRRQEVEGLIEEAERQLDSSAENTNRILNKLYDVYLIEEWWKTTKKIRENNYAEPAQLIYTKNAKNYFESFVLMEEKTTLDDEYLMLLYDMFIDIFIKLDSKPSVQTFKKEELFNQYIKEKETVDTQSQEVSIDCDGLKEYLNTSKSSKYTIQKSIRQYLSEQNYEIPYFRVIARTNNKVREAFPFPSSTFTEIYQDQTAIEDDNEKKYKSYEKSSFCQEIRKEFPIFVIDWIKDDEGERYVDKIRYFDRFSFINLEEKAKLVYERTIDAFIKGDENELPQMSEDLDFHVRPKAINAEDTFEFSNGKQITKRTFWANKNTMNELLEKLSDGETDL